jgi:transposase
VNTYHFGGGRPWVPDRQAMNGIFFILRMDCRWKALDATGICSGGLAHVRFQASREAGVVQKLFCCSLR